MNRRYILSGFFLSILVSIGCSKKPDIPDVKLMTELIKETIIQDSLDRTRPLNDLLINYYIYEMQKVPGEDDYYPPPPLGPKGEPFVISRLRLNLKWINNYIISSDDSVSIIQQVNLNKNIKIKKKDFGSLIQIKNIPFFDNGYSHRENTFSFLIPIFNNDRSLAWIEYNFNCASCGYGKVVLFRKINNKWIKVDSYVTWQT
jgi:hypothetical protein